jgi:uncharacterized NAD-dependent epimerase/dehydratase family protein
MHIEEPYLLFLGDASDALAAKTSIAVAQWRPERCVGQLRLPSCKATSGLPDISIEEAVAAGAKTLIIGATNRGGVMSPSWIRLLVEALRCGLDLANALHEKLTDIPEIAEAAQRHGRRLFDVRHSARKFPIATGEKRPGKRLLTVGTDCSIGKMYTALALEGEMRRRGLDVDFRATGQTGILIAGDGVAIDTVVADFLAGCVETLSPANDPDHWDVIEGQGSLFHPSYAGITHALLHGSQPDVIVMCHEPGRPHLRGIPGRPLPDLRECIDAHLAAARVTNADVVCLGVSLNTSRCGASEAERLLKSTEDSCGLPCVDPSRTGVGGLVELLLRRKG